MEQSSRMDEPFDRRAFNSPQRRPAERDERAGWVLTPQAFERLLQLFDADREIAAEQYELMHRKLIKFFEWRGHPEPERLADETLNRVARKLSEGTEVRAEKPSSFILGVARMLYLESRRKLDREQEAVRLGAPVQEQEASDDEQERMMRCLDECLERMTDSRELLLRYYTDSGAKKISIRKRLAEELGVTAGVLRLRAHRLRGRLESCVSGCNTRR